jgi:hypothetical protein
MRAKHSRKSESMVCSIYKATKPLSSLTAQDRAAQPTRAAPHVIFCDVVLSNEEGERYDQGTALVALPTRAA